MLVAIIGPACSGKTKVAEFLRKHHGFQLACLSRPHLAGPSSLPSNLLIFDSAEQLLEHATAHWRDNIVTLDLNTSWSLGLFEKRPFFLLVSVDAPLGLRWNRSRIKSLQLGSPPQLSLEDFIVQDDSTLYGYPCPSPTQPACCDQSPTLSDGQSRSSHSSLVRANGTIASTSSESDSLSLLQSRSHLRILNSFTTTEELDAHLRGLDLPSHHRLRPTWDTYFISLCTLASLRSNCMKRRVGAVLVRSNRVLSTGYNGTPRGLLNCNEGGCARCNASATCGSALDECLCLHAEENALLEAGRDKGGAEGTVIYCNTCPCLRCAVKIVQTGVKEVIYQLAYSMDDRSAQIFADAGVVFRQYTPPT
ncbi:hypothetical protein IE53DRAFT_2454 [Violaceomyces palustris]|uniref:Uncharacterized protein n=1 Tax=Violaceomyces palustris TaxID=1673888 RepID=A0ACD0P834_9BASI|nr:hypothetical protein IE53DRAFT_2454 [Violaceomyces palustris]